MSYDKSYLAGESAATAVCKDFHDKKVVVPAQLQHGLFIIGALDNLDYNPLSTTSKGSFHGTGINLFQFPSFLKLGDMQNDITLRLPGVTKGQKLPDDYTTVPAVALQTTKLSVPQQLTISVSQEKDQLVNAYGK